MSSALQYANRSRAKSFILCWPGDDQVELKFNGETILAPSRDAVSNGSGRFRFESAKDGLGNYIPGTLVIRDRFDSIDGGQTLKSFDAEFFLLGDNTPGKGLIGINEPLVARGLMIVDDVALVPEAHLAGRGMWEEKQAEADAATIAAEFTRRQIHEKRFPGVPCPADKGEEAVLAAVERQKTRAAAKRSSITNDDLIAAMGGVVPKTTVATLTPSQPTTTPTVSDEPTLDTIAEHLDKAADKAGVVLTKDEWKGLARRDASVMQGVRAKLEKAGVSL